MPMYSALFVLFYVCLAAFFLAFVKFRDRDHSYSSGLATRMLCNYGYPRC